MRARRARVLTDPGQVAEATPGLARVYRVAFAASGEGADEADRFATEQLPTHSRREGFRLVLVEEGEQAIAFGYGYTGERGQWWSDWVAGLAPARLVETWVGGHFELVELAVDPARQGEGLGARVHDLLLDGLPHERALLTTYREDGPAPRLYQRLGWRLLADLTESTALYGLDLRARR